MSEIVTVYMPTKNRVDALSKALESIFLQTYENIEVIVVDDGSTDGTYSYLMGHRELNKRLIVIKNVNSQGACVSRNLAIKNASGKYITGCDDDDMFASDRIKSFIEYEKATCSLESGSASLLFSRYVINGGAKSWRSPLVVSEDVIFRKNFIGNQVFTLTDNLVKIGGFDENLKAWQDYDCWIRLIYHFGPALLVNSKTYLIDTSSSGRISSANNNILDSFNYLVDKFGVSGANYYYFKASYLSYPGIKITKQDLFNGLFGRTALRYLDLIFHKFIR